MNLTSGFKPCVAIACGGTGGHLFPGLAVAHELVQHGCDVTLLISPKEIDQEAVKDLKNLDVHTLPAVGLTRGSLLAFSRGFRESYRSAKRLFKARPPQAVLAMGGFTSAPPVLAAKRFKAHAFLHESNTIPGRANRLLSWIITRAFVGFPSAAKRLHTREVIVTGTPVRPQFHRRDPAECRAALGLDPARPVVLAMGGSQGASAINQLVIQSLPLFSRLAPTVQWFHLTGPAEAAEVTTAYAAAGLRAVVHPFFSKMELGLGAATVAVSRAGASSLAELAAMRVPSLLIPYPAATDNHQLYNARAFEETGAARVLEQRVASPEKLTQMLLELLDCNAAGAKMQTALKQWDAPRAAQQIAEAILQSLPAPFSAILCREDPAHSPGLPGHHSAIA
jgi:UDP-N-acetylglucosamine--N-acetylmuramyl-(pentapeptide) pyrophosphoryl-undecaprenol N-acetylglucosamine transferase